MIKQTLAELQETAGFEEPLQRSALGGFFNLLFFLSILDAKAATKEPQGALLESIEKSFTDFESFKEAFKKVVAGKF